MELSAKTHSFLEVVRGLVRPFIAVSFVVMVAYLVYSEKVAPNEIMTVISVVVGFYFGERAALKKPKE